MEVSTERRRRSTEEVGELIVDAARALFRSHGFEATSTRAIAERAGVAESMIFRRYENKNALFEDAVIGPFVAYVDEFTTRWRRRPLTSLVPEELAREYVCGLYRLCREHRDLLALMVTARTPGVTDPQGVRLVAALERHQVDLAEAVARFTDSAGIELAVRPEAAVALTVSAVLGAATIDDGRHEASRLDSLVAFVMRGVGFPPRTAPLR